MKMKENEKVKLKRIKKTGMTLDRLKPNTLYPGPNGDFEYETKEEMVATPEVDLEKEQLELEAKLVAEKAKREAEEKAKREAEEKAKREAEEKAKREAEEKAKREAEEKVKREAEEKAKREAEEKAKREAEEQAKREAEEKARKLAAEKAKMEELKREQVSAAEVKTIVSDETAQALIEQEEESEKIYGTKKAIINLDTISTHFAAGETVTVNILKQKKLVDKNVYFVKVLARGVLDKPLTVKAQDFSLDAAKMIELTGGRVVMLTKKKYFD